MTANLSGWNVSGVTDMYAMFHQTNAFDQNLGKWYIVLDDTVIEGDNATGTVGRIAAQNSFLGAQSPAYGIGSGVDSASFEMDGASIRLKAISDRLTKDLYTVNVTSSGGFGTNNFRILDVSVGVSGIPLAAGTGVNQTSPAVPSAPPGTPQNLRAISTDTTVTLTWDETDDDSITGYKILSRTPATQSQLSVLVDDTGAPGISYVIEGLDPDTVYVFRVIAVNAHGESDNSNFVRLSTDAVSAPANAPDAPQSLRAASTDTTVTLTWDETDDDSITGYKILSRTPATQSQLSVLVDDTGAPGTSYVIEGLDPDTVYVFRVIAVNAHGESDNSNFVMLSTDAVSAPANAPDAPQSLRAASTDTTVTLTWDETDDDSITGYKILSRTPATQSQLSVLVDDTGAPGTSYVIEGLDPDTVYVFRVIAVNAHGESDNSNFVRLSTLS